MKVKNSNVTTKGTRKGKHKLPLGSSLPRKGKREYIKSHKIVVKGNKEENIDQDAQMADFCLLNE